MKTPKNVSGFALGALVLTVAAAPSASARVCENLAQCRELRAGVDARIAELEGASPTRVSRGAGGREYAFTRDTSIPALGDAWRDPSGIIWGDIARNAGGSIRLMSQPQASSYCEIIGARLPGREDFERLRSYMGNSADSSSGYVPQALPNLYRNERGRLLSNYFWSSSINSDFDDGSSVFSGRVGIIYDDRNDANVYSVRCVASRSP